MNNIFKLVKNFIFEIIIVALILIMYKNYIPAWIEGWTDADSFYAFGFFLIGFYIYLIKTNFELLKNMPKSPNNWGLPIIIIAFILYVFGYRASIHYLVNISFPLFISGIILTVYGRRLFLATLLPVIMFAFSIPTLPLFRMTMPLQLLSAKLTSMLLNTLGLTSYNEGSIVTVNNYKLSVVAGCSGLKSLSTLIFTSTLSCYFLNAKLFKKIILVLCCFPLAIIMNMFRISLVALYTIYNGYEGMEKFHDNLGIFIFIISLGILLFLAKSFEEHQETNTNET